MVDYKKFPDKEGRFGIYGGRYVAETLIPALEELSREYYSIRDTKRFQKELQNDLRYFVGRPSPLYFAKSWTKKLGGAQIYLKREDLNHTGAHKINNCLGQILLAKKMNKTRIIAETILTGFDEYRQQFKRITRQAKERFENAAGLADIIVAKQRHGPIGRVGLKFSPETTRFHTYAADTHVPDQQG